MEKWTLCAKKADYNSIAKQFEIDPVTAVLIRNRDIIDDANINKYLHGDLRHLHNPQQMKDIKKAISLIELAIKKGEKVRVIGDYDIDGIMATYILHQGLKEVGANVDAVIPHRITDGYGLSVDLIEAAVAEGVDTIITCDNGIAAKEQIEVAKKAGLTVIVTDHHEVPYEEIAGKKRQILPSADAIIDPKQEECEYPFKELCGAAVAYKLIIELYHFFGLPQDEHEKFLEYVAMATICDVMELVDENRILVKEGLKRLQSTPNIGLQELIKVNALEGEILVYHIGFVLGPCLNASGRLDAAMRALELLETTDISEATRIAGDLKSLNDSRKEMTIKGVDEAIEVVEGSALKDDKVLVVYLPNCHESLAGIIAGRLRERYYRPTIVLTNGENGIKGSGRSIEEYSMYDELVKCQEFFSKFGGHPMAAGMSLNSEADIVRFRKRINELCALEKEDLMEKVVVDVAMPLSYIKPELITEFEMLQPFGKGNSKPVFARKSVTIQSYRVLGKNNNVVKMKVIDSDGFAMDAIYFGENKELLQKLEEQESLAVTYYPTINSYMGRETMQIVISHYK